MRFGIIGFGGMGRYHAEYLLQLPGIEIVALCDPNPMPASVAMAARLGLTIDSTATAMLSRGDVDAVLITTPTDTHAEHAIAAAQAGKHIFCQYGVPEAGIEIDAANRAGVRLAVGHVVRYFPEYAAARALVLAGEIGVPGVARALRLSAFPHASPWFGEITRSGGVVVDMMIHDFDWMRWTFGPVVRVHALGLTHTSEQTGRDAAMVVLRFQSGALGYVEGSWCYRSFHTSIELSGSGGLIRTDSRSTRTHQVDVQHPELIPWHWPDGLEENPYKAQLREVTTWMAGGPAPRHSAADGYESLRIALAALESMQTGIPVQLGP